MKASRSSLGRAVLVVSSTVGAKVTKIVCRSSGRITRPISRSVVLSLTVSQRTVQNLAARLFFLVSLKEKLFTRSSRVVGSRVDSVSSVMCARWCIAHVTRTRPESSRCNRDVALKGCMSDAGVAVKDVDGDK